jgi:tRNA nucleotidyltransferase (CCA-adding enzyme)
MINLTYKLDEIDLIPKLGREILSCLLPLESVKTYFIGGGVRDILLGRPTTDIDILIVSKPEKGLEQVLRVLGDTFSRVEITQELTSYFTAKVLVGGEEESEEIDLVFARKETFLSPGAKAIVDLGDLESDLLRRDFSVNALAFSMKEGGELSIVDLVEGVSDIEAKKLRVLHRNSFRDDPIRILRGLRLAGRLGFEFEEKTFRYLRQSIIDRDMQNVSIGRRIFELNKFCLEPEPYNLVKKLEELDILDLVLSVSSIKLDTEEKFKKCVEDLGLSLGFWAFLLPSLKGYTKELIVVLPLNKAERKLVFEYIGIS